MIPLTMTKKKSKSQSEQLYNAIVEGMQENKANDIVVLDLRELDGAITEFFVICSGDSDTHVDGIANSISRHVRKEMKEKPWKIEGKTNSDWVLLDYVNVVGHIFYKDKRSFYDIEELWSDATRTNIPA